MAGSVFYETNKFPIGSQAFFYDTGTYDKASVYLDELLMVEAPQPLFADGYGVFPAVYHGGATGLRVDVQDADGVSQTGYPLDPVWGFPGGTARADAIPFIPTEQIPETNVQDAIEAAGKLSTDQTDTIQRTLTSWPTAGTGNAYTITPAPAITSYGAWQAFTIFLDRENTGTATLNVNDLGPQPWRKRATDGSLSEVAAGDLLAGATTLVQFDGTQFVSASTLGAYLVQVSNLADLQDKPEARDNLGLGTAAVVNTGTGATDVPTTSQADGRYLKLNQAKDATQTVDGRVNIQGADAAGDIILRLYDETDNVRHTFNADGDYEPRGQIRANDDTLNAPTYSSAMDPNSGLRSGGNGNQQIVVNGIAAVEVTGTVTIDRNTVIEGDVNVSGDMTVTGTMTPNEIDSGAVMNAISRAPYTAVGHYAMLADTGSEEITPGEDQPASSLRYSNARGDTGAAVEAGTTWEISGYIPSGPDGEQGRRTSLFKRKT